MDDDQEEQMYEGSSRRRRWRSSVGARLGWGPADGGVAPLQGLLTAAVPSGLPEAGGLTLAAPWQAPSELST